MLPTILILMLQGYEMRLKYIFFTRIVPNIKRSNYNIMLFRYVNSSWGKEKQKKNSIVQAESDTDSVA